MDIITKVSNQLVVNFTSLPVLNLLPGDRLEAIVSPKKRRLKPLIFLDVIFGHFLEGKIGHLFSEGKVGQPVQNLLQVTLS
ncbi:hypothetical protein [Iningainema tapete]|uniref:Uncharacterized protein n=1 Tax=Iningainema tapete BLCC-T55 TaxID=2748662 RepID=A0A8J7C5C4_9CYAN|nr:hypothetical protein [Iningainema tapete]MBD2770641.1 hypothetical protein [Iningainema tapete BLCC-T55]